MTITCIELIKKLQSKGFTKTEIAEKINVTWQSVHRYSKAEKINKSIFGRLRLLYIKANNPKYKELDKYDTVELVRALRARGWTVTLDDNNGVK